MNVKEAIAAAKSYVKDVYAEEQLSDLGLEETEYDEAFDRWNITLGFSRPWDTPRTPMEALLGAPDSPAKSRKRAYKVITVSDAGEIISMKNRQVADADV